MVPLENPVFNKCFQDVVLESIELHRLIGEELRHIDLRELHPQDAHHRYVESFLAVEAHDVVFPVVICLTDAYSVPPTYYRSRVAILLASAGSRSAGCYLSKYRHGLFSEFCK